MNENPPTVLIVEDDVGLNHLIRRTIEREGFKTHQAFTGAEALAAAVARPDTLILMDYLLPDMTGKQLVKAFQEKKIELPLIVMSGHGDERIAVEVMKLGAREYIIKEPNFVEKLPKIIRQTLDAMTSEKELAKAEEAVRESEERYRTLFDDAKDGIALADAETGRLIECNQALCGMVEKDKAELLGQIQSALHPAQSPIVNERSNAFASHASGDPGIIVEDLLLSKSGKLIPVEIRAARVRMKGRDFMLGVFRDVTQRKLLEKEKEQLQAELLQAQKLEAVGTLAGGVAHDFNNLLTVIIGYLQLSMNKIEDSNPIHRDLKLAGVAAGKAVGVVRQLLLFSRKQPMESFSLNVNETIVYLLKMLTRLIGENVAIDTKLAPDLWTIQGDEGNIEQVIMNLAINARDSMAQSGRITIGTENAHIDEEYCKTRSDARPGAFVRLSISDTGTGMDSSILEHIFEPFFTTKEKGKGTGLGLSVVYGIVKQHDGWIVVESKPGQGTTFKIYLPASPVKIALKTPEAFPIEKYKGKGERVLVVEDQEEVREVATDVLKENGYTVFHAENAEKTKELFAREKGAFDLVFSDLVLPDESGVRLVEELSLNSNLRVLFTSGYIDNRTDLSIIKEKKFPFLQKPFTVESLLKAVRETLDEPGQTEKDGQSGILSAPGRPSKHPQGA
jgi:two-component system, cell cycle sensor histidine kinase and response regulator CckA